MSVTVRNFRTGSVATYNNANYIDSSPDDYDLKTDATDDGIIAIVPKSPDIILEYFAPCSWTPPQSTERSDEQMLRDAISVVAGADNAYTWGRKFKLLRQLKRELARFNMQTGKMKTT